MNSSVPEHYVDESEDGFIVIKVTAPLSRPKSAAILVEDDFFVFEASPYFMKIKLASKVSDNYKDMVQDFNGETSTYTVRLKKAATGGDVQHEDCLTLEEKCIYDDLIESFNELAAADVSKEKNGKCENLKEESYGFCDIYSKMFGPLYNEFSDVFDLPEPDTTDLTKRKQLQSEDEAREWCDESYLADNMETEHVEPIIKYEPPWREHLATDELSEDEKLILSDMPKIKWSKAELSEEMIKQSERQVVEILFAYVYNKRTTEGENTVESAWTIRKLSGTLSWFNVPTSLGRTILGCYKRCLTYPLFRSWKLTELIQKDVVDILRKGVNQVTRCFIEVKEIFQETENYYILNTLYINDLCQFVKGMSTERLQEISNKIEKIKIKKYHVNVELPILEVAGMLVQEEKATGETGALPHGEQLVDRFTIVEDLSNYSSSEDSSSQDSWTSLSSSSSSELED